MVLTYGFQIKRQPKMEVINWLMISWEKYYLLDWVSMVTGLIGLYQLGNKNKYGFLLSLISVILAGIVSVIAGQSGLLVANFIQIILMIRGYVLWDKDSR